MPSALGIARLSASFVILALASATAHAAGTSAVTTLKPGTLQVCLYGGFPPFAYQESGSWKGWDVDYLAAFAKANDLAVEVVEEPQFQDVWLRPGEGKCDIAGSGISDTAERRAATKASGLWSSTYYAVLRSFLVRSGEVATLTKIEDLQGKTAIVTKGSTAHTDLCNRMQVAKMSVCASPDGEHPCPAVGEASRQADASCVRVEYLRDEKEENAASDIVNASTPDAPFAYGAGYGSIQTLAAENPKLALAWPHCNMGAYEGRIEPYAEPFSFVVASTDTGLLPALNTFIESRKTPYAGTAVPDLGCKAPPWTLAAPAP